MLLHGGGIVKTLEHFLWGGRVSALSQPTDLLTIQQSKDIGIARDYYDPDLSLAMVFILMVFCLCHTNN